MNISEVNHSPKSWKWTGSEPLSLEDANGKLILETFSKPTKEDAALIKASPYLLRGCQMALEFFYANRPPSSILSSEAVQLRSLLEKGIKEAEGVSS